MSSNSPQPSASHSAQPKGRRRTARWVALTLTVLAVLAVSAGAWILYTGLQARDALVSAADAVAGTQNALLGADVAAAQAAVDEASGLTASAAAATSDPVWTVVGALPWIGANPRAVTLATDAADQVVSEALPDFVAAAATLDVDTIKDASGKVDLARLAPTGATLAEARSALEAAADTVAQIPTSGVIGPVRDGVAELSAGVDEALAISATASQVLSVMPTILGEAAPQTYFVAFQSPVEIRGTGGFLGTYGVLTVDGGELVQRDVFSNNTLTRFDEPVVDLGPDYRALYGRDPALWVNMNMSPHFPYAGVQWATAYNLQFNSGVAGVMAVDITALQFLIQATGPVTAPNGKVLTADNVVQYLGNDIYFEFEGDNAAREQYQADVATQLIERVLELQGGSSALVKALTESVSGGHLQLWSSDPGIQTTLETTALAGATPTANGPYVQLVLNNGAGNKLDFYTERTLEYLGGECAADQRQSTVRATLLNNVPPVGEGPSYIYGRVDGAADGADPRSNRTLTYLHLPVGSQVTAVRIDGEPAQAFFGAELGHTVALLDLELPAGIPVQVELDVTEPLSNADPVVPVQPMVTPQETVIDWFSCGPVDEVNDEDDQDGLSASSALLSIPRR